jgi:hypothetical protein
MVNELMVDDPLLHGEKRKYLIDEQKNKPKFPKLKWY